MREKPASDIRTHSDSEPSFVCKRSAVAPKGLFVGLRPFKLEFVERFLIDFLTCLSELAFFIPLN